MVARRLLESLAGEPLPEWDVVGATISRIRLVPGDYLFGTGSAHPYVYCVRFGLCKLVYDTANGDEWIKAFAAEGQLFASASALAQGGRTTFSAVAVEESVVEKLDYRLIRKLADRHIAWERTLSNAFHSYGAGKEKREMELLTMSAEERYRQFLREHPALTGRVPQRDLARFLGVTPVGLSRIKRRVQQAEMGDCDE